MARGHTLVWGLVCAGLGGCGGLSTLGERDVPFDSDTGTVDDDTGDDTVDIPDTATADTDLGMDTSDTSDTGDTGDTGTTTPPVLAWDTVGWTSAWSHAVSTDTTNGLATFSLDTVGVGGATAFFIADTRFSKDYDEEHTLEQVSSVPNTSSSYARTLSCGAAFGAQTADASTVFDCQFTTAAGGIENNLAPDPSDSNYQASYAAAVWAPGDTPGVDAPADCITFGLNGDLLIDSTWMGSTGTELVPPSWLTAGNCRVAP